MRERIDIFVREEKLAQNAEKIERLEKTHKFEETDRAPVVVDMQLWASLAGHKSTFSEISKSPRHHLRGLILNYKYRYEYIHDDLPVETKKLIVEQDFGAIRGVEFPMQVVFQGDDQPKTIHMINSPEDIDELAVPDPYSGFNKMRIDWYKAMSEMVDDFDVRLNGESLELEITINHPGGPIPSAFALCGSNLFMWMMLDPDRIHRLMEIVTESHLNCIAYMDEIKGTNPNHNIWVGADTGDLIGPSEFQEFVVPYYLQLWEHYKYPRVFHMCGKIDHLIEIIRDDFDITYLNGFGFPTDRHKLADGMAGRVVMRGGPHPVLIQNGPVDAIIAECSDYIRTVGRHGGYILSEGFGITAGTPPQYISAMVDASKRAGWVGETLQN